MNANQRKALDVILGAEGEWSNHPADRGGLTRWGITIGFLRANDIDVNGDGVIDAQDLADLTLERAEEIYLEVLWRSWMDAAPQALVVSCFDLSVNAGPGMAAVILQRALSNTGFYEGKVDGKIGPKTIAALGRVGPDDVVRVWIEFVKERALFYARIVEAKASQNVFIEGWIRRAFT